MLGRAPLALQRRAVRQFLRCVGVVGYREVDKVVWLLAAGNSCGTYPFGGGERVVAVVDGDWIVCRGLNEVRYEFRVLSGTQCVTVDRGRQVDVDGGTCMMAWWPVPVSAVLSGHSAGQRAAQCAPSWRPGDCLSSHLHSLTVMPYRCSPPQ